MTADINKQLMQIAVQKIAAGGFGVPGKPDLGNMPKAPAPAPKSLTGGDLNWKSLGGYGSGTPAPVKPQPFTNQYRKPVFTPPATTQVQSAINTGGGAMSMGREMQATKPLYQDVAPQFQPDNGQGKWVERNYFTGGTSRDAAHKSITEAAYATPQTGAAYQANTENRFQEDLANVRHPVGVFTSPAELPKTPGGFSHHRQPRTTLNAAHVVTRPRTLEDGTLQKTMYLPNEKFIGANNVIGAAAQSFLPAENQHISWSPSNTHGLVGLHENEHVNQRLSPTYDISDPGGLRHTFSAEAPAVLKEIAHGTDAAHEVTGKPVAGSFDLTPNYRPSLEWIRRQAIQHGLGGVGGNPANGRTMTELLNTPEGQAWLRMQTSELEKGGGFDIKSAELQPWVELQPHQQRVADRVSTDDPRMLVYHGLGTGKSLAAIAAAEAAKSQGGGEYGIVAPASLRDNFKKEVGKFTRGSQPEILSYTEKALGRKFKTNPSMIIFDECLPAGTLVDGKPIEAYVPGDRLRSVNHAAGRVEYRRVVRTSNRPTDDIYRVVLENGDTLVCTDNHPLYTQRGYVPTCQITENDCLFKLTPQQKQTDENTNQIDVRSLRSDLRDDALCVCGSSEVLLSRLSEKGVVGRYAQNAQQMCRHHQRPDAQSQSNEKCGDTRENGCYVESDRLETGCTGWEWNRTNKAGTAACGCAGLVDGCCVENGQESGQGVTDVLQAGCSQHGSQDCDRDRREVTPSARTTGPRSAQNSLPCFVRVVRVEIYQRGCDAEFERLCPGGVVYDIEVDGNHNFFARDYLVHNSHRLRNPESMSARASIEAARNSPRVALLTGSPITNHPTDLAGPLSILKGQNISPEQFEKLFVQYKKVKPGWIPWLRGVQPGEEMDVKHPEHFKAMFRGHVDYNPGKSPEGVNVNEEVIDVPMTTEQERIQKAIRTKVPPRFLWKIDQEFPLSRDELGKLNSFLTGMRQVSLSTQPFRADKNPLKAFGQSGKLQTAMQKLQEVLNSDERKKAIIYSNYIDAGLQPYAAALKDRNIPHAIFHGGVSPAERRKALDEYNAGKLRALLIGPAGAEGISTKGTSLIQLLDPHWNETRSQQAKGRGLRFDSHMGLPEELKDVAVQRFISRAQEPGWLKRMLFKAKRQHTGDEILDRLSKDKEKGNDKFRKLLQEVGTEQPG